ncbi:MAG TPA: DUF1292 domain-containing protein [Acholeplasmataceae bacterium]|jgi:uncharacterized protein YrzB (UPF0473 family)|nr:DUF1292 domain-containing protein [Acholeplasmataceae bacterium]
MEKENRLTFIDEDGNEVLCEILFTFESKEFNKNYVLFYPVGGDEDEIEVMAASYIPTEDGEGELQAIETAEEWQMIEEVLDQFSEDEDFDDEDFDDEECDCEDEDDDHDCDCGH